MSGVVLHQGASPFDGKEVVVIATFKTANPKTGDMAQVWVLPADVNPVEAVSEGLDGTVCGGCPLRAGNGCYVNVGQAPLAVWRKWTRGGYPEWDGDPSLFEGRKVRWGAYGDPVCVPLAAVESICSICDGWTGYTHAWRDFPEYAPYLMASVESPADREEARRRGWRTFRVKAPEGRARRGEKVCPASVEAGWKTTCERCLACGGAGARSYDVVIDAHGRGAKRLPLSLI